MHNAIHIASSIHPIKSTIGYSLIALGYAFCARVAKCSRAGRERFLSRVPSHNLLKLTELTIDRPWQAWHYKLSLAREQVAGLHGHIGTDLYNGVGGMISSLVRNLNGIGQFRVYFGTRVVRIGLGRAAVASNAGKEKND